MATVDDRLSALEAEVSCLREQLAASPARNWIEAIAGSFRDEPAFEDVLRFGREARRDGVGEGFNGNTKS